LAQETLFDRYDVIRDIHGQADKLVGLLRKLGYTERQDAWRHPERTVTFVGDLIESRSASLYSRPRNDAGNDEPDYSQGAWQARHVDGFRLQS
jgi:hypothetical protein